VKYAWVFALLLLCSCAARQPESLRAPSSPIAAAADDDDDEDDSPPPTTNKKPVEYVRMSEWEPPPSVKRIEAEVPPRGDGPQELTSYPPLTLHKPVGETSIRPVWRIYR